MDTKQLKDHKQIGQEQELFFTDELAPGAPFWLPKGMVIYKELEKSHLLDHIGKENICADIDAALARAEVLLN